MNDMWWDVAGVDKLAGPIELAWPGTPDFFGAVTMCRLRKLLEIRAFNLAL
jgi:hypothetical protein